MKRRNRLHNTQEGFIQWRCPVCRKLMQALEASLSKFRLAHLKKCIAPEVDYGRDRHTPREKAKRRSKRAH